MHHLVSILLNRGFAFITTLVVVGLLTGYDPIKLALLAAVWWLLFGISSIDYSRHDTAHSTSFCAWTATFFTAAIRGPIPIKRNDN